MSGAAFTTAIGALAAALLLTVFRPAPGPPTIDELGALGFRPALDAAPRSRPGHPGLVTTTFDGVPFPNWSHRFGWHTTGARGDTLAGRTTETVYYGHMGHRIGYTVVSGSPLRLPPGGRRLKRNGVTITLYGEHMHAIAVFERRRHTCVLAGHVAHLAKLIQLASWKDNGSIHF